MKNKTSKSLSSLAVRTEEAEEQQPSKLNRASLHLPLSSHKVSPCLSAQEETVSYKLYKDVTAPPPYLPDGQGSAPESFTLSEVATQTEIHYRRVVSHQNGVTRQLLLSGFYLWHIND